MLSSIVVFLSIYFVGSSQPYLCDNLMQYGLNDLCECSYFQQPTFQVICTKEKDKIEIESEPLNYLSVECLLSDHRNEYDLIPDLRIGPMKSFTVKNCQQSISNISEKLGLESIQSLTLEIDDVLSKEYFMGMEEVTKISLKVDNLVELPDKLFKFLPRLNHLVIDSESIRKIRGAISDLNKLHNLEFTGTNFTQLEEGTFDNMRNLKSLKIQLNNLESLNKEVFKGLQSLKRLLLSGKLESVSENVFSYLSELETIEIIKNEMPLLPKGMFKFSESRVDSLSPQITTLILRNNKIKEINESTFEDLINIETLNIERNCLTKLKENMLIQNKKLRFLNLAYNYITAIPR